MKIYPINKSFIRRIFILGFLMCGFNSIKAQKTDLEISGDILQVLLPTMALSSTFIWKDDQKSFLQLGKSMGVTIVLSQILKSVINKKRPNGRNFAFPSGHTATSFTAAGFLEKRYGWEVGIPAYLLASYVGWTRMNANKHDIIDVLGGAIIGVGSAYIFTKPWQKRKMKLSIGGSKDQFIFQLVYNIGS